LNVSRYYVAKEVFTQRTANNLLLGEAMITKELLSVAKECLKSRGRNEPTYLASYGRKFRLMLEHLKSLNYLTDCSIVSELSPLGEQIPVKTEKLLATLRLPVVQPESAADHAVRQSAPGGDFLLDLIDQSVFIGNPSEGDTSDYGLEAGSLTDSLGGKTLLQNELFP